MGSYSVIAGDRCLEAFNLELEARKAGGSFGKCEWNSFPNQILFETLCLFMLGLEDTFHYFIYLFF